MLDAIPSSQSVASLFGRTAELELSSWAVDRVEMRALGKMVDEYVPQAQGGKLSGMLEGSDGSFETAKQRFLGAFGGLG